MNNNKRNLWSSRLAFIIATSASAVGLGNIWKFPYIAGENGGSAFVLFYIVCIFIIGIPVMIAETAIGRAAKSEPTTAMGTLAQMNNHSRHWRWVGAMTIIAAFIILSFYSMITGWTLDYIQLSLTHAFDDASPEGINALFSRLTSSPGLLIFYHSIVMLAASGIIALGIKKGIEYSTYILMPMLLVLLLLLIGYAIDSGYFGKGLSFLFSADFSKLSAKSALIALGHAFFTLSLGVGIVMTYGSYLQDNTNISKTCIGIAIIDTVIALLAGLAIFPLVFANHLTPSMGPGLIFQTLPLAFGHMPMGWLFAAVFFVMLLFAAFTSTISLFEPCVAWLTQHTALTRVKATILCGVSAWLLGFASILSLNVWSDIKIFGLTIFDGLNYLTANIMMPLGGLGIAIFAGYVLSQRDTQQQLANDGKLYHGAWRFVIRYISPVAIVVVFLNMINVI
jgi:neurotransmitter:Na+ symporter, NSS family